MESLGFEIGFNCMVPKTFRRMAMNNYLASTNSNELLSFLGVVHFFSRHIERATDRIAQFYDMLKGTSWNKKKPWSQKIHICGWQEKWGEAQEEAFGYLRS